MSDTQKIKEIPAVDLGDLLESEEQKTEFDKVMKLMLDKHNIRHNTELNRNEITAFSALGSLAKKYHLSALKDWLEENLELRVSKGRKGRGEWVKIIGRQMAAEDMQQQLEMRTGSGRGWFRRR